MLIQPFATVLIALTFSIPTGELFSTAEDTAIFFRMLLNDGEWNAKRYLRETAFSEVTPKQLRVVYSTDAVVDSALGVTCSATVEPT